MDASSSVLNSVSISIKIITIANAILVIVVGLHFVVPYLSGECLAACLLRLLVSRPRSVGWMS